MYFVACETYLLYQRAVLDNMVIEVCNRCKVIRQHAHESTDFHGF